MDPAFPKPSGSQNVGSRNVAFYQIPSSIPSNRYNQNIAVSQNPNHLQNPYTAQPLQSNFPRPFPNATIVRHPNPQNSNCTQTTATSGNSPATQNLNKGQMIVVSRNSNHNQSSITRNLPAPQNLPQNLNKSPIIAVPQNPNHNQNSTAQNPDDVSAPCILRISVKMKNIFPEVKYADVQEWCKKYKFNASSNEDEILNVLIDHVLTHGVKSTKEPEVVVKNTSEIPKSVSRNSNTASDQEIPMDPRMQSIFIKLKGIFPEVRKGYIKSVCIKHQHKLDDKGDEQNLVNILVDYLLKKGSKHLEPKKGPPQVQAPNATMRMSIDDQCDYLQGIFSDADSNFLRKFVLENGSNTEKFEQFIRENLESPSYPTIQQYLAKLKVTEQTKQYTIDFRVEKFLEIFPDPFKHFEDRTRKTEYLSSALEFLKSQFKRNKVVTISKEYRRCNYNISLTAHNLCMLGSDMKGSRGHSNELLTDSIPLLQEFAYIKHKREIRNYIDNLKSTEENLFKELKEKNLLITCQCCFNDECMPDKCIECMEGHVFCTECIIRGTDTILGGGETKVGCFTDCNSEFSLATLQKALPPTKFSALLKKRQAAEVEAAGIDGLVACPFCPFASIPPPNDKVFKCLNPECMKESCRLCKKDNHVPYKCGELEKTDKVRLLIEEKMTEALIRTCYKCKRQFLKDSGCNKMTCSCGAIQCYICDKPVTNYNHFNSQGSANSDRCPLWTDDRRMEAEGVITVAKELSNNLKKANPNINIDIDKLLPKLPPSTRGPHQQISNANLMTAHARRIVGELPVNIPEDRPTIPINNAPMQMPIQLNNVPMQMPIQLNDLAMRMPIQLNDVPIEIDDDDDDDDDEDGNDDDDDNESDDDDDNESDDDGDVHDDDDYEDGDGYVNPFGEFF